MQTLSRNDLCPLNNPCVPGSPMCGRCLHFGGLDTSTDPYVSRLIKCLVPAHHALGKKLDGKTTGRFSFNLSTANGTETLTIYNTEWTGPTNKIDEELSFTPDELVDFCRFVLQHTLS